MTLQKHEQEALLVTQEDFDKVVRLADRFIGTFQSFTGAEVIWRSHLNAYPKAPVAFAQFDELREYQAKLKVYLAERERLEYVKERFLCMAETRRGALLLAMPLEVPFSVFGWIFERKMGRSTEYVSIHSEDFHVISLPNDY